LGLDCWVSVEVGEVAWVDLGFVGLECCYGWVCELGGFGGLFEDFS